MSIDPRSDRIALYYTGDDAGVPSMSGVPARNLTEGDIARLVYERRVAADPYNRPAPLSGAAGEAVVDKLMEELTKGPYRKTDPAKTATPAEKAKE